MCDAFIADVTALGCRQPDIEPRTTLHVPDMITLIEELEKAGIAYRAPGGNISVDTGKLLVLHAKDGIELRTGSASIVLKSNGEIEITGTKITVKSSGDMVLKGQKIVN